MPDSPNSIKDLFSNSWNLFKKVFVKMVLVNVLTFLISAITAIIISAYYGFKYFSAISTKNLEMLNSLMSAKNIIIVSIVFIVLMFISMISRIVLVLVASGDNNENKVSDIFKKSLKLIFPIIVTIILVQFLVLGGVIFLVIPGIIFGFLLQFVIYEVILNKNYFIGAVNRSLTIVMDNFVDILVRLLIFFFIYVALYSVQGMAYGQIKNGFGQGIYLVIAVFIISIFLNFFSLVYHISIYKQYKDSSLEKKGSHPFVWGTAIIGWLFLILLGYFAVKYVVKNKDEIAKSFQSTYAPKSSISKALDKNQQNINPQTKIHWDRSEKLFLEIRKINSAINDSNQKESVEKIKKLNDENILVLKSALAIDPKISRLWYDLGSAYSWISSTGTLEDSLNSFKKAEELDPNNVIYINGVGDALISLGKYEDAVIQFQKTLRITDRSGFAHESLGTAYYNLKMTDLAKENYQKAIDIFTKENQTGQWDAEILKIRKYIQNLPK